jgi:hypothetical protein
MLPNSSVSVAATAGATHSHARLPLLHLSDPSTLKPSSAQHMVHFSRAAAPSSSLHSLTFSPLSLISFVNLVDLIENSDFILEYQVLILLIIV